MRQTEYFKGIGKRRITGLLACVLTLVLVFSSVTVFGEEKEEDPVEARDKYLAVLYDNTNGLPTAEANAIAETEEGFLWIASYSGLIRYDGQNFTRISSSEGLASVISLFVDRQNRLWVGTNDSGAFILERDTVTPVGKKQGLHSASVRAIVEDTAGRIFLGTTKGVAVMENGTPVNLGGITENIFVRSMTAGKDGRVYGVTQDGAVFTIKEGKPEKLYDHSSLGISDVISLMPDDENKGAVYLGTEHSGLYHGTLDNMKEASVIDTGALHYINTIEVLSDKIWIGCDNGIGMMENGAIVPLDNVPLNNSVGDMLLDYAGNLWFTSSRQGVMKIVPNQFLDIFSVYDLPAMVVNATCFLDDRLYIGGDRGLIAIGKEGVLSTIPVTSAATASKKMLSTTDLLQFLEGVRVRSVYRNSENELWISTYSAYGLICFKDGKLTCYTMEDGLPSDRVRAVFERRDKTMLATCSGHGVVQIKGDKAVPLYEADTEIGKADILTIEEMEDGRLILGSDGDGIFIYDGAKAVHLSTENGLSSDVILRVKKDRKRDLFWIVTSNSLGYLDVATLSVTTITSFPYSNNFDLYENEKEEMWVLSSNGVYVDTVEHFLKNEASAPVFYSRENGLGCIATANSYSELTEKGELYIAGTTGVSRVNIEEPFESVNRIKVAVPFLEADGKRIYPDAFGSFVIPADVNKVTVHHFVFTYSLINPQITYYLDGFDKQKTTLRSSEIGPVIYTNLSGGHYRYVIQLKDAMGLGDKELTISIIKKKKIYEQLWFQAVCVLAAVGAVAALTVTVVSRENRKLKKKQEENKLLVREIVEAFAKTIDMKDAYTRGHSSRVAEYTEKLSVEMGLDSETVEKYRNIALLHDIGKIGVPPEVLNKPGKLTDEEFAIIKSHSALGYHVLKDISIMPELAIGAGAHHERPDGRGYPKGLKGEEIPQVAQIIAVADTFDAMYSDRPYRKRMNFDKAVSIIKEVSGTQLSTPVVEAFLRLVDKGEFRLPDDDGGGSTEDINNIHKKFEKEAGKDKPHFSSQ